MLKYFNIIKKNGKLINYYNIMKRNGYYVNINIVNT